VVGVVIAAAIERLYNDELWRDPKSVVSAMEEVIRRELTLELAGSYIDWNVSPSREELLRLCVEGAVGYLSTMKKNRLLGPYARSEVDLTTWVDKYTPIGGRPDVIIRRDDTGILILDGKNSKTPGKYTNPDQLRWYALCFYLAYQTLPTRLAFVYFRYPEGKPPPNHPEDGPPWTGLVEVPFDLDSLKALGVRAKEVHHALFQEKFAPKPSSKACRFCRYKTVCEAHAEYVQLNLRKPSAKNLTEEEIDFGANGIVEFGIKPSP
jgi:hypothetical protein